MIYNLASSLLLFVFTSYSDSTSNLRLVPVDPTAEAENVNLTIQYPENNELKNSLPILVQIRNEGYPLGIETETQRRYEIRKCDKGQTIRVVIDDNPYILLNEDDAPSDAFDNHDLYFRQSVQTFLKNNIKAGDHLIRVYPAYSFGESVRGDGSYNASIFCFKKQGITKIDLSAPMITYNEPQGSFSSKQPILIDFLVHNCVLSQDGYKVKLSIDDKEVQTFTTFQPYYMYDLPKGSHKITLQLVDRKGALVNNPYSLSSRTITIW